MPRFLSWTAGQAKYHNTTQPHLIIPRSCPAKPLKYLLVRPDSDYFGQQCLHEAVFFVLMLEVIALADDFLSRFSIVEEAGHGKTSLSRPLVSFHPEAAAKLGADGAAHFKGSRPFLEVDETVVVNDQIFE